jgi:hypothetical protein
MKGYPKLEEWSAKIHSLFIEFLSLFFRGQFFIIKGKVVPVIKHCIAAWAVCDVVSVMLMYSSYKYVGIFLFCTYITFVMYLLSMYLKSQNVLEFGIERVAYKVNTLISKLFSHTSLY